MKWIAIFALAAMAAGQDMVKLDLSGIRLEMEAKTVTGAPYSAQAVTETTQVLPDGNRITRRMTALVARDSQGRTRREQRFDAVGPWATSATPAPLVFISDPVAGIRYRLETGSHTAARVVMNGADQQARQELETKLRAARLKKEAAEREARAAAEPRNNVKKESLGSQVIEGVQVEGTRVTETIPAGRIGNDRPIDIVNETWTSPELQTVVMSKHSDPRVGDVTYTLTNLSRAEPDPALFTVPSDYTVTDDPAEMKMIRDRRP